MKFHFPSFHRPAYFNKPATETGNAENRPAQDTSHQASTSSNVSTEHRRTYPHSSSMFKRIFARKNEPRASTSTATSANAAALLHPPTFHNLDLADEIFTIGEQVNGAIAEFMAKLGENKGKRRPRAVWTSAVGSMMIRLV